ncbi:FGGY-family carbohydrate kinase [Leucobacter sp. NPDC015123]|uniref:xylulokinase n=1 Tax=Leucobacter sp. NPDC015123 TaxID=3364129 RepID=UPI0036F47B1C
MTPPEGIAIGLDLGTSSLKAIAVGVESGRVLFRERQPYPTHRPELGAAEQAPQDWMAAAIGALARLAAATGAERWVGIGLSAMLPTLVCLDADGEPVGSAIVWEDTRAETEAEWLRREHANAVAYERTGQQFDGRYLVPMFLRLRDSDPEVASRTVRLAGAKDYLFEQLTGELLTDPSTAAGSGVYDLTTGAYAAGPWPELPPIAQSSESRGLDAGVARLIGVRAGIPVALGGADSVLGAEALGTRPGLDVAIISGTSTVVLGTRRELELRAEGQALVTPLALGGYGLEMDLVATGSAFQWLTGLTGATSVADLMAEASTVDPLAAPAVLPYVGPGEQGALWEPGIFGAFHGLTLATTRGALMRGLLTGVILELRRCIFAIGPDVDGRIIASGSSLASPLALQDLADACGREVLADESDADHSALGAIATLLVGLGKKPPTRAATLSRYAPDPGRAAVWEALAARHDSDLERERSRAAVARADDPAWRAGEGTL